MTTKSQQELTEAVLTDSRSTRDAMSAGRIFGKAYEVDGRTIIPVATASGGGGGGGGEGTGEEESGVGFGSGFGLNVRPVGVYEVTADGVTWKAAIDATRLAKNFQILAGIVAVCLTALFIKTRS